MPFTGIFLRFSRAWESLHGRMGFVNNKMRERRPRHAWSDSTGYDEQAAKLANMFADNFRQYLPFIDDNVKAAAI